MATYSNPDISDQTTWKFIVYLDTNCAIFTCHGNPEGIVQANTGSLALSDDGNVYKKTTDTVATGWINLSGGGGGGANQELSNLNPTAINQDLLPNADGVRLLGNPLFQWQFIFALRLFLDGTIQLRGTTVESFSTPAGSLVPTKINILTFNPGPFGQILALGMDNTGASSARVISLFDQRGAGHQPTLQVFNPAETDLFGLTWDGSNSIAQLLTTKILMLVGTRIFIFVPNSPPSDSDIPNSTMTVRLDEAANQLSIRVRYSDGTLHTGVVNLV